VKFHSYVPRAPLGRFVQDFRLYDNYDLARPLHIEDLVARARMSVPSFQHHFKAVTAMSPLQYLKRPRLTHAQKISPRR